MLTYGFEKTLATRDFDRAVDAVTSALQAEGFGIITEIDIKETLKQKLDADFRPYKILGACNPKLAHGALQADAYIGLLLPCNVVVQETGSGEIEVSTIDPQSMFSIVGRDDVKPIADEVEAKLRRVIASLE